MFNFFSTNKNMQKMVDDIFKDFAKPDFSRTYTTESCLTPDTLTKLDENGNRLLSLSLVGHNKDSVSIKYENGILTVESVNLPNEFACEFKKKYKLTGNFYISKISATFVDGVLTITIPENKEIKDPGLKIDIK